ncbi:hypothetical protein SACIG1500_2555 [Staphylococcus aureus subsp. aureus CIG1500]|nr:hypothetical protein SACIG1500_2555 [Staphylococcus aureus subsp. aureus CIG1500]
MYGVIKIIIILTIIKGQEYFKKSLHNIQILVMEVTIICAIEYYYV